MLTLRTKPYRSPLQAHFGGATDELTDDDDDELSEDDHAVVASLVY